jgi:drug/metabolite transporter (DMT)-like permease
MIMSKQVRIHAALAAANAMFGLGSIVGALGLAAGRTNPLAFTFVRQVLAGMLLLSLSLWTSNSSNCNSSNCSTRPVEYLMDRDHKNHNENNGGGAYKCSSSPQHHSYYPLLPSSRLHWQAFARLGLLLFLNQAAYIVGLALAGPVIGSIWQPTSPILTAGISMLWCQWERWNWIRFMGVLMAFAGCAAMVLFNSSHERRQPANDNDGKTHNGATTIASFWIDNVCFFSNCLAMSFYVLQSKQLLSIYPSLTVIGWSYILASLGTLFATFASSVWEPMEQLICPACDTTRTLGFLYIHPESIPALVYYILAMSVGSWGLIVWSNQYATGTLVVGYNVIQPVVSVLGTIMILHFCWVAECRSDDDDDDNDDATATFASSPCLYGPGMDTLCGMLGVACGLYLVIQTEPSARTIIPTAAASLIPMPVQDGMDTDHHPRDEKSTLLSEYGTMPSTCIAASRLRAFQ